MSPLLLIYAALTLTALGLPIPEDVSLLTGGILARAGRIDHVQLLVVGYLGVLTGDLISFHVGRRFPGATSRSGMVGRIHARFGDWMVVFCRHVPGLRGPAFFLAGSSGMGLKKFLVLDGTAAIITVWLWVSVGWWIGPHADRWMPFLDDLRFLLLMGGVAVVSVVVFAVKMDRLKIEPETSTPS